MWLNNKNDLIQVYHISYYPLVFVNKFTVNIVRYINGSTSTSAHPLCAHIVKLKNEDPIVSTNNTNLYTFAPREFIVAIKKPKRTVLSYFSSSTPYSQSYLDFINEHIFYDLWTFTLFNAYLMLYLFSICKYKIDTPSHSSCFYYTSLLYIYYCTIHVCVDVYT